MKAPIKSAKSFMTTAEAAIIAEVTLATIINWCSKYDLGVKVGTHWRIDRKKLLNFLGKL